jgi:hypothetical protein
VIARGQVVAAHTLPLTSDPAFINQPISLFHRVWPVASLATAVIVNLAWMGFLGYGLVKLAKQAFF